jgi:hypothetical protein
MGVGRHLPDVLTHWPGTPTPVPPVLMPDLEVVPARIAMWDSFEMDLKLRPGYETLATSPELKFVQEDDRWFLDTHLLLFGYWTDPDGPVTFAELPEEFYLRSFLELDVKSPEAVGQFCAAVGPVGLKAWSDTLDRYDPPRDWPRAMDRGAGGVAAQVAGTTNLWGEQGLLQLECWVNSALQKWLRREGELGSDGPEVRAQPAASSMESVRDVRWFGEVELYQSFLRDMRNLWDFLSGGRSFYELLTDWSSDKWGWDPQMGWWTYNIIAFDEIHVAQRALEDALNPALACYSVRIQVFDPEAPPWATSRPWGKHTVYSAMCLQLANQIAQKIPYRRCKNERCGRLFAVKTGPDRDWHRSRGVLHYCSDECANRQYQREHRRRKRDARRAAAEALKTGTAPANHDEGGGHDDTQ